MHLEVVPDVSDQVHEKALAYRRKHPETSYVEACLQVLRTDRNLAREFRPVVCLDELPAMPMTYGEAERILVGAAFELAWATGLDFLFCFKIVIAHPKGEAAARLYLGKI